MEAEQRRIIEILAGAIFIVFLFLLIFIVIGISERGETTITNSYNTYNIYPASQQTQLVPLKPYVIDREDYLQVYYVPRDFRYADVYAEPYNKYLRYHKWGQLKEVKGVFGNNIYRYEVHLTNREYVGGYFTVKFYFEDYRGRTISESITHYIPARAEKLFLLKDISSGKYKYRAWWYEVKSLTKAPTKVYYN
jgi:hypothetical protein